MLCGVFPVMYQSDAITPPVTAEGYGSSHHRKNAEWVLLNQNQVLHKSTNRLVFQPKFGFNFGTHSLVLNVMCVYSGKHAEAC